MKVKTEIIKAVNGFLVVLKREDGEKVSKIIDDKYVMKIVFPNTYDMDNWLKGE